MKFSSDEIASVLQEEIEQFDSKIDVREVGTVLEVGDGIARVYGLSGVMAGEMVEFPNGAIGLAFNLEENSVGVIILGNYLTIQEGDEVKALADKLHALGFKLGIYGDAGFGDTLKRADESERSLETVPRERLWRALTPQMFRVGLLRRAPCGKRQRNGERNCNRPHS